MIDCLVTGAPGWLANQLVEVLVRGSPECSIAGGARSPGAIRCLVKPGCDAGALTAIAEGLDICQGDLRSGAAVRQFCQGADGATLFHLAGVIHPAGGVKEFFEVNVAGTRALLAAAAAAGVRRAVVVSSNSPFGFNRDRSHRFDELSPYNPYMGYGRSKMLCEQVARQAQDKGPLETVIIRVPWFYGPHQPARQTTFFRMIRRGRFPIVGDGENLRSLAYVGNVCQGLLLAGSKAAAGTAYWIADRRPYTMNEIVGTIERLMEREFGLPVARRRLRLPGFASSLAEIADGALQSVGIYHQKIHVLSEMSRTIACSIARAEKELGYDPAVELEEGMRRALRWCIDGGVEL